MSESHWVRSAVRSGRRPFLEPLVLVAPFLILACVFVVWPVLYSVVLSLTNRRLGFLSSEFVGLANYVRLLSEPRFAGALRTTALFSVATVAGSGTLGLALALALRGRFAGSGVFRVLFVLPVMATGAAMTLIWRLLFDTHLGLINSVISGVGMRELAWLEEPHTAFFAVVVVEVWRATGYALLLFSAGLATVPREIEHAAMIDGAGAWQRFRHVTWHILGPTTLFTFVVLTARSFQSFDTVRVLTDGGPQQATKLLSHLLFEEAFSFFNIGFASSVAVVFFAISMIVSVTQFILDRKVHYQ